MSAADTERSGWHNEVRRQQRCQLLGHPDARWVRRHTANDSTQICYWCDACDRPVTQERYATRGAYVTAAYLKDLRIDPDSLPSIRRNLRYALCARCYATRSCELHHTAMQAAFEDADEWPVIPLCSECHLRFTRTFEAYVRQRIQRAISGAPISSTARTSEP